MKPIAVMRARGAAAASGGGINPAFANVKSLSHFEGADGSTSVSDEVSGVAWTITGGAAISTSTSRFGGSSLAFTGDSSQRAKTNKLSAIGTSDFCMECWASTSAGGATLPVLMQLPDLVYGGPYASIQKISPGVIRFLIYNPFVGQRSSSDLSISDGAMTHFVMSRIGGVLRGFVNGVLVASMSDTVEWTATSSFALGGNYASAADFFAGNIDESRFTVGDGIYTANFTPPTAPFPNS